ncbi:MAG: sugar ABC transporter ATP-binding protein [Nocardioidaceae bacterium]|nr:sugar ABC transporter ATP-binding protein [Nocardioidaceae bacterium]
MIESDVPAVDVPALEISGLSNSFGPVRVLREVDLTLRPGEIHGLLGINGSGKSTLIKILSGLYKADEGTIRVDGTEIGASDSHAQRYDAGLRFMHQDIGLCPSLSVTENLFAGHYRRRLGCWVDYRSMRTSAAEMLGRLGAGHIDPSALVAELGPGERALVGLARALGSAEGSRSKVIVLDEPTTSLTMSETERLFDAVRRAARAGVAVLFVSHDMEEVLSLTDRVTVLRDGRVADSASTAGLEVDGLVRMIVGDDFERADLEAASTPGGVLLDVRSLAGAAVHDLAFRVHEREVVGLTGLVGAGHEDVPYLLVGARPAAAEVVVDGVSSTRPTPRWARSAGISLLAADRLGQSAVPNATVRENATLGNLRRLRRWHGLDFRAEETESAGIVARYEVVCASDLAPLRNLSGGNQQKVLLGRIEESRGSVIVLHAPTQGVDVGSRQHILRAIRDLAEAGAGVLVVSNDYEELEGLCDRVLVMRRGRLAQTLQGPDKTHRRILSAAAS